MICSSICRIRSRDTLNRAPNSPSVASSSRSRCSTIAAEKERIYTLAALGCRLRRDEVLTPFPTPAPPRPVDQRKLPEHRDRQPPSPWPAEASDPTAEEQERAGIAYLEAHLPRAAGMALQSARQASDHEHAIKGGDTRPRTGAIPNAWALLLNGDASGAARALDLALAVEPRYAKARANRAALRCRFGDLAGARHDLALLEPDTALTGVDPEWARCRGDVTW